MPTLTKRFLKVREDPEQVARYIEKDESIVRGRGLWILVAVWGRGGV